MQDKKPAQSFVIDPAPTIKWPVIVSLPADGGEIVQYQFTGIFKRVSEEALDKILGIEELPAIEPAQDGEPVKGMQITKRTREVLRENAELFPQLLVGWEGVKNAAGEDAAFSVESMQAQIVGANGAFLSAGLWSAIREIRTGARLGN